MPCDCRRHVQHMQRTLGISAIASECLQHTISNSACPRFTVRDEGHLSSRAHTAAVPSSNQRSYVTAHSTGFACPCIVPGASPWILRHQECQTARQSLQPTLHLSSFVRTELVLKEYISKGRVAAWPGDLRPPPRQLKQSDIANCALPDPRYRDAYINCQSSIAIV